LHLATAYGNTKIVRRLLIAGADRKLTNNKSQTPLEIA
jgi:ankyrin repeat protein